MPGLGDPHALEPPRPPAQRRHLRDRLARPQGLQLLGPHGEVPPPAGVALAQIRAPAAGVRYPARPRKRGRSTRATPAATSAARRFAAVVTAPKWRRATCSTVIAPNRVRSRNMARSRSVNWTVRRALTPASLTTLAAARGAGFYTTASTLR